MIFELFSAGSNWLLLKINRYAVGMSQKVLQIAKCYGHVSDQRLLTPMKIYHIALGMFELQPANICFEELSPEIMSAMVLR